MQRHLERRRHLPLHTFPDVAALTLPQGCPLVGIELIDDAIALPSFRHPRRAAYVLGSERGTCRRRCWRAATLVQIPTRFWLNLSLAGALVMYDRMVSSAASPSGRSCRGARPRTPRHVHGAPKVAEG